MNHEQGNPMDCPACWELLDLTGSLRDGEGRPVKVSDIALRFGFEQADAGHEWIGDPGETRAYAIGAFVRAVHERAVAR